MRSPDERIVTLLQEARTQLEAERSRRNEPIAIVGMGCRFPGGASSPSEFWRLLGEGFDATGEVPVDRWQAEAFYDPNPDAPGKAYTKRGAFLLEDVAEFDAEFFGISPREALGMDPQQRLLLEVVWEALEDAGVVPEQLRGSATGVWVGLCTDDYARQSLHSGDPGDIDAYNTLGSTRSIAAGRISYVLDLHGPAVQLDTACSSSLVAIHQACQSLRSRECELALVGGVNLMLAPEPSIALCKLRALAPDGRCKTFDASADGYGRGEGCGVLVLKRLSEAQTAGDRIYAVVRGSACNHDGHSNGLTAPSGIAQEAVIRSALVNAGVDAASVGYVEAHGTGTLLGDPIEVLALHRVYGQGRAATSPLQLGAVKTNFGHLEGAAGVAGVIKAALSLTQGRIPRHLHLQQPNLKIPWAELAVKVASESVEWARGAAPRFAGVSSFGISGTNAHVILEEAPASQPSGTAPTRAAELIVLSAKTAEALPVVAGRLREHLEAHPELGLRDVAQSLATTRSLLDHRLTLTSPSRIALLASLAAVESRQAQRVQGGVVSSHRGRLAWLFTGQGAQRLGMGQQLYTEWAAFREALDEVTPHFDGHFEVPLRKVMWAKTGSAQAPLLDQTGYTQPAMFALEWALAQLWRSWGLVPDFLLGHSVGELTAACVSGVFSLSDAARLVRARALLMQALPEGGAMVSIAAPEPEVQAAVAPHLRTVSVAAINGPASTVISGVAADVLSITQSFASRGIQTKRLSVSHAFHSPLMDPMLEDFRKVAESIEYRAPHLPLISNLSGRPAGAEVASAEYWVRHVRQAVRFSDGVRALHVAGAGTYLELGPRATLLGLVPASSGNEAALLLPSLQARHSEPEAVLDALGGWVARGGAVDWAAVFPAAGGHRVELPTYPWQQQRYWREASPRAVGTPTQHPLLGRRLDVAGLDAVYAGELSVRAQEWLKDHLVNDHTIVAGAALVELIRAAGSAYWGDAPLELKGLIFQGPLLIPTEKTRQFQVALTEGATRAALYSRAPDSTSGTAWELHASAALRPSADELGGALDVAAIRKRCRTPLDVAEVYARLSEAGLQYSNSFKSIRSIQLGDAELLAEIRLEGDGVARGYGIFPAILDGAFQALAGFLAPDADAPLVPFGIESFVLHQTGCTVVLAHVRLRSRGADGLVADVTLADPAGRIVAEVAQLGLRRFAAGSLGGSLPRRGGELYQLEWRPWTGDTGAAALSGRWLVVATEHTARAEFCLQELSERGASCDLVTLEALEAALPAQNVVCLWDTELQGGDAAQVLATQALRVGQVLVRSGAATRLWWCTRGAVAVRHADDVAPFETALWGLGRTLRAEHPELGCTLIDLDPSGSVASALGREVAIADGEAQVAWRGEVRHTARLIAVAPPALPTPAAAGAPPPSAAPTEALRRYAGLRLDGTVLITGGLGALGLAVARHLAERGLAHLLLIGRHGLSSPGALEALAALESLGTRITVVAVDVADHQALAGVIATVPPAFPLRGVVHAAGVLDDGVLLEQTPVRLASVMGPKVRGAWNLHLLTQQLELDWFVLFSSMAGLVGSAGQSGYAAANAFLDGLALHRSARGLAGQSIAWGPWGGKGLVSSGASDLTQRLARRGLRALPTAAGLELLDRALHDARPLLMAADLDRKALARSFGPDVPQLWRELIRVAPRRDRQELSAAALVAMSSAERRAALLRIVQREVADVLSLSNPTAVSPEQHFADLGMDSLMAVQLRTSLGRILGVTLPAAFLVDARVATASALAERLGAMLSGADGVVLPAVLRADAELEPSVRALDGQPLVEPRAVLLTGATGFLGAFLLAELWQQTSAEIVCLVRAASVADGRRRLVENLRKYQVWNEAFASRISVVVGDLTQPRLGLSEGEFAELADRLDAIYNNGVSVSFVAAYEELKPSHVGGAREILRLATTGRTKTVHHVSSTTAYSSTTYREQTLPESSPPLACEDMVLPYAQCKWVTEALMRAASARGVPVVIYRPAVIGGSSANGVGNTDDFICRLTKSAVDLACLPGPLDILLDFSPVDYVARSIVGLSQRAASIGGAFNLHHPVGLDWTSFGQVMRALGHPIELLPYDRWVDRVESSQHSALYPLLPFLRHRGQDQLTYVERMQRRYRPVLGSEATVSILAEQGIHCPPLDATLIERYLVYLRSISFIE